MSPGVELRAREFDARQTARALRRAVFEQRDLGRAADLVAAEAALQRLSDERAKAERNGDRVDIVAVPPGSNLLGRDTTGIDAHVTLKMTSVPTALVHLFDRDAQPLVAYDVQNTNQETKRLRFVSYVEGYSAHAIDTVELKPMERFTGTQLPTFFPERLAGVTELTRATLNVEIQDLDARTELHETVPLWLLARTTALLKVQNPADGAWNDLTHYLGAYVTPNASAIMNYLRTAVEKLPERHLVGYQVDAAGVERQVQAVFEALATSGVVYVNSIIDFTPEVGSANQRVRLPREALADREANCIDGTLLMASLLEAISLNPAIVIVPGHAFLGWETGQNSGEWRYCETTMLATAPFADACAYADRAARTWLDNGGGTAFTRHSLRDLRARGITPLE